MTPRTHNMLSYLGALVSAPLAAFSLRSGPWSPGASVVLGLWSLHFLRRTLESAFVHRYSKATVPLGDALIEYAYYWGFGVWIGSSLSGRETNAWLMPVGTALFLLSEAGNARSHLILRALRGPGESQRVVPHGFLFEKVSCPHYLFEILTWISFILVAQSRAAVAFCALGTAILVYWATTRHRAYKEHFNGQEGRPKYPADRRALVPFLY